MISFAKLGHYGRLGNQLFQYAYLRTMARRLGVPFYCPRWDGDDIFDLDDADERASEPIGIVHTYDPAPEAGFTPKALEISDGTEIQGFFQSERYYDDPAAVRSWYTFRKPIVDEVQERYGRLPLGESTSFSLRLDDDYNNTRDFFPLYPVSFYSDAARALKQEGPILVFADRPNRAREFLRDYRDRELVFVEDLGGPQQLYLMTQCGANVITNSTFAWWGAWLNAVPGRRVVAPTDWTRPGVPTPIRDILCDDWIKIPSTVPVWDHFQVWRLRHPIAQVRKIRRRLRNVLRPA